MKKVTILVPAYNEAASLPRLVEALDAMTAAYTPGEPLDYEYLVVNDGSRDDTLEVLRRLRAANPRVHCLSLSRNWGKEAALLAGMDHATGDCVVIMDADLQHPVEAVPQMIDRWLEGWDDVYGRRKSRGRESWLRKMLTRYYYHLLESSSRIEMLPNVGDFRLLDRRAVDAMRSMREAARYTKGLYCYVGYRKTAVEFETRDREAGQSSFSFKGLFRLALEGLTSFTTSPLRIASVLGIVVSVLAITYLIFIIVKTLVAGESVQGFPTLMCVILFLGGCQLITIGIIGEYVGRIYTESKRRPPYIADTLDGEKLPAPEPRQ